MALVQGYSSDEEENVKMAEANPFGIAKNPGNPAKRMKLDGPSLAVVAAPDVLSEVWTAKPLNYSIVGLCVIFTGSSQSNLARSPPDRLTDARQHHSRRHAKAYPGP